MKTHKLKGWDAFHIVWSECGLRDSFYNFKVNKDWNNVNCKNCLRYKPKEASQ